MARSETAAALPIRLRRYLGVVAAGWTAAIAVTLTWELLDEHNQAIAIARSQAQGVWEKGAAVRRWDAASGGVYVPISKAVRPDSYLKNPDRDITTPSGEKLTLLSPVAIMRNIQELTQEEFGVSGHITSLRPLAPSNAPDPWEKNALEAFAKGKEEVWSVEDMHGAPYLRLMRPLLAEQSCLKCHAEQGYKLGDIRGGISVSIPMSSVKPLERSEMARRLAGYGGMWALGLLGIGVLSRQLGRQVRYRYEAERNLQKANETLEQRVAQRTAELAESNERLQSEIVERQQAERWLLESEQRFRGYFEQGLVGMAILSEEKEWVEVNERLCKMLGYPEAEITEKTWTELAHPDDRAQEDTQFTRMLNGVVKGYTMPRRFLRRDGQFISTTLSMQCMRKEDGTIDCILVLVL